MKKKLQVFISSTYSDLKEERQAAVQAVLDAGHIPAGMELFKAGNESQLTTVEKWIDQSDVYMLILGGRYGSIEPSSGKSYSHVEYEYALDKKIPVFAVILSDSYLHSKAAKEGMGIIFEMDNIDKYKSFKEFVLSKMIRKADDEKDIKLTIHTTLSEFIEDENLSGWIKGDSLANYEKLLLQNAKLLEENSKLSKEINKLKAQTKEQKDDLIGDFSYTKLKTLLVNKTLVIPGNVFKEEGSEDIHTNALKFFIAYNDLFCTGITNKLGVSKFISHVFFKIAPFYVTCGLLEKIKVAGVTYEKIQMSKIGMKFTTKHRLEGPLENV